MNAEVPGGLPDGYSVYVNLRYGFRLAYPNFFRIHREPENGDGCWLTSGDGRVTVHACGSNLYPGRSLTEDYVQALAEVKGIVTEKCIEMSHFVIAWRSSFEIGYTKTFMGTRSSNTFTMSFPRDEAAKYDPLLLNVVRAFQPGDLTEAW